mmetsp:Transcript_11442/g.29743  ORF Transcript_11442/g.29743 Transcript_11442/m.29743 type:complete len:200 (-) Transcript_11442:706-1305(-)
MSSSQSKHSAVPSNESPSFPVILATEPSGARLPYKICRWPDALIGCEIGTITSCPSCSPGTSARFSASVFPVTVMHEPSSSPSLRRYLSTAGVPPTRCTSSITYLPDGLRSAMNGTESETSWKVSRERLRPTARPIAIRWSTALVEPPRAITVTIALRNAAAVMMSDGLRSSINSRFIAAPAATHSAIFSSELAGLEDE